MLKKVIIVLVVLLLGCLGLTVIETFHQNQSLLPLTEKELSIYKAYIKEYNDTILADASPILVCKFYMYAISLHDAETCYELLNKEKEYNFLLPTKEVFITEYMFFEEVGNWNLSECSDLRVVFNEDNIHAQIEWSCSVKNDDAAKNQTSRLTFSLIKNSLNVWKVAYQPLEIK